MPIQPILIHNGQRISQADAVIPVFASALTGALGVYETIVARGGKYVALHEHLARLQISAHGAGIKLDVDLEELGDWCQDLLAANGPDGLVRVLAIDLDHPTADVYLYQMTSTGPTAADYERGVAVEIFHGERALPNVKSFNTLVPGLARKAAVAAGVHDALLVDRNGDITEGSNCNVFAIIDGVLVTAPPADVLAGTVMDRVIRLAGELGIPFERRKLPLAEVWRWQEAFLTSSRRGVLPICRVAAHELGGPGPITRRLGEAYRVWEEGALA